MPFSLDRLDHVVINCRDAEATASWYERVLGMTRETFGPQNRIALKFGNQKFNVRPTGAPNWITAEADTPGSLDLCFITSAPLTEVIEHLQACGVTISTGPIAQQGAMGAMTSVYFRDPDGNLLEIGNYANDKLR
jgi:catechol 2,3-dioxygenase-like lactoylglutathione lyase family enzyme